jgi:anti-anti-sigma regulatory factor
MDAPKRRTIICDIGALTARPDVTTIDALARTQLALRAHGLQILLRGASAELVELIELVGLSEVLPLEPGWQAEQGEDQGGVEEERELDDLAF